MDNHSQYTYDSVRKYFDDAPSADDMLRKSKHELVSLFNACKSAASENLIKYLRDNDSQPALSFLKQCCIFNPIRAPLLSADIGVYPDIPDFDAIPRNEFALYLSVLVPEAMQLSGQIKLDNDTF